MSFDGLIVICIVVFLCYLIYLDFRMKIDNIKREAQLTSDVVKAIKTGGSDREGSFAFT